MCTTLEPFLEINILKSLCLSTGLGFIADTGMTELGSKRGGREELGGAVYIQEATRADGWLVT